MPADCIPDRFQFEAVSGRRVEAAFDGGVVTSDAGGLLLGLTYKACGLPGRFAACFQDRRNPGLIEHSVETLLRQRVMGLAMGYEDLNDHDTLRRDPVMALLAEKLEARREDCEAVAGKSTLNRLELSGPQATRYHKIAHDGAAIERLFVDLFLESREDAPQEIILDFDATDDPLHGDQEGRFFHGYYDCYCYLPLYVFCGHDLLAAKLRRANIDGSAGAKEEACRIVAQIRARWPKTRIILRADSGFAREELMAQVAKATVSTISSASPATSGSRQRLRPRWRRHARRPKPQPSPPAASRTSSGPRAAAGAASAGWWARPSGWATKPTRASW